MPILGISEIRRFSRGGKLRLGEKKIAKSGAEYPAKSDHFIANFDDPAVEKMFAELYGEEPKRVTIAFPSEDLEVVFPQYLKCYGASGLLCKGDGRTAMQRSTDDHTSEMLEVDCPGPADCPFAMQRKDKGGRPGCKKVGSLQFFIPDLPVMQVFQIDTSSWNSIVNINSQLDILRSCCGRISFLPADLVLKPQQAVNPENGKKVNIYVLDLVVGVGLRQINKLRPMLGAPDTAPQLPAPSEELPDDLYPASVGRAQAAQESDGFTVDAETGEVLDAPEEPEPVDLGSDPDVQRAFEDAGFPPAKRNAMLASATDKATLLHIISVNAANGKTGGNGSGRGASTTTQSKSQVKPQPSAPVGDDDPLGEGATLF